VNQGQGGEREEKKRNGYVLYDVLMALFLFSLGFAAIFALDEAAIRETREAITLNQAVNLAETTLEKLAADSWRENILSGACVPGGRIQGSEDGFRWTFEADWTGPAGLLRVCLSVEWQEDGKSKIYVLESLYDADNDA
jgi:hypothetical protein